LKYKDQIERLIGAEKAKSIMLDEDGRMLNNNYRSEPGHSWYYTYEELRPLLAPVLRSSSSQRSIIEIGCGDVPLGSCIQHDDELNSFTSRIVCFDYSVAIIKLLK